MLVLRGTDRGGDIFTCGGEAGKGAGGDGFHKLPDVPLTFPLGLVILDLSPFPPSKRYDARSDLEG